MPVLKVQPVSLNPRDARHEIAETLGQMCVQQIDRPPLVLTSLPVPCGCGRPLVGQEYAIFGDGDHNNARGSVFVRGFCVACGIQTAIFAPPAQSGEADEGVLHEQQIAAEVGRMVDDVIRLRTKELERLKETA